ncbi:Hypothetical protein ERS094182_01408 [Mycobacterium tuberculosis]|uniref:Uncharacterized protein n=6 Tax=Mycobacterium tuberculosis complex TaxID=77643 RepID=A0A0E7ZJU0_MYCTX|nr:MULTISPECIES: hypothetical protein [Mycobacterium]EAY59013.1 hypothetical protein TBCG_00602 [Mycobacterium tuberculosis C]EFO76007.1 hypothetical protein TMAG_02486 [Mycobacterium tuberculosis SUMu001]EFP14506.1 hypothetical protein TMBG_03478 [Mycobacterium tuberculosis SUMu002]EFP32056.1 hypothetical protein TMFG_03272 [Mycobacterium tuberculosis SUMu006]EFP52383.1 hypothetical protein TMKG_03887 [Mycobacterium tuberculosis SUMu011]EFP56030.1 hypothetical protein TMLG_03352 [Mycobacteri
MLPGPGARRLTLGIIPEGGAHIDVPRKTVGAWQTADTMGIFQALPDVWGGWRTECWEDRFEEQLIRCNGALRLPELDLAAGMDSAREWLRDRIFQRFSDSPAGQILKLSELLADVGPGLVVSDDAVTNGGARPNNEEWARFVAACDLVRGAHAESA